MRAACLTIGSLFWERDRWKRGSPDFANAKAVSAPIRYGRISKKRAGGYTMVLCSPETPWGRCFLVPLVHEIDTFPDLVEAATAVALAEEINDGLSAPWGAVALLTCSEAGKELHAQWARKMEGRSAAISEAFPARQSPINVSAVLDEAVLGEQQLEFDFVFAAVTKPEREFPSPERIVALMGNPTQPNKAFKYFEETRKSGISTFEDEAICRLLRQTGFRL